MNICRGITHLNLCFKQANTRYPVSTTEFSHPGMFLGRQVTSEKCLRVAWDVFYVLHYFVVLKVRFSSQMFIGTTMGIKLAIETPIHTLQPLLTMSNGRVGNNQSACPFPDVLSGKRAGTYLAEKSTQCCGEMMSPAKNIRYYVSIAFT